MTTTLSTAISRLMADTGMNYKEACAFFGRRGNRSKLRRKQIYLQVPSEPKQLTFLRWFPHGEHLNSTPVAVSRD